MLPLALAGCGGGSFSFFWSDDDLLLRDPFIVIESPTTEPVFVTDAPVLALAGRASHAVRVVVVNTSTGVSVPAQLSSPGGHGSWLIEGIALQVGSNVLLALAEGEFDHVTASDTLTVTRRAVP
ncbi:hypothetical protein [Ramlibacter rhizophilus]|uniref:Uncharacterized protein n=1 Tax=Ramlibacter rhizophilus TaxID=1781167 RepID=A0A4Z0BFL9_9BURK|nr:hypothetical protein [Ramlibacter rhizophilus]TFY96924.1 hypothetical protein EZ242_19850 [Ramlibacter rhizophilus]